MEISTMGDSSLQPFVLLQRLSEEVIEYYTKCKHSKASPNRTKLKYTRRRANSKDACRIDFAAFEQYRRSREGFLLKKSEKNFFPRTYYNYNPVERKKKKKLKLHAKKDKHSNKRDISKKSVKRRRPVIETDSDDSVENYGIIYSNEKSSANIPFSYNSQYPETSAMSLQNQPEEDVVVRNNSLLTHQEVMDNEHNMLTAIALKSTDDFCDVGEGTCSDDLLGMISKNNVGNELQPKQIDELNLGTPGCVKTPIIYKHSAIPLSAITTNTPEVSINTVDSKLNNLTGISISAVTNQCTSGGNVQSFDVVSKIMQDMDTEFSKRKKLYPTIISEHDKFSLLSYPPYNNANKNSGYLYNSVPPYGENFSRTNQSSDPVSQNFNKRPVEHGNLHMNGGRIFHMNNFHKNKKNPVLQIPAPQDNSKDSTDLTVAEVVGNIVNKVSSLGSSIKKNSLYSPTKWRHNRIKYCLRCSRRFTQHENETICSPCKLSSFQKKNSPTKQKYSFSPAKRKSFSPVKKGNSFSPIKQNVILNQTTPNKTLVMKNDTSNVHVKPIRSKSNISSHTTRKKLLKNISTYDQRRLMYKEEVGKNRGNAQKFKQNRIEFQRGESDQTAAESSQTRCDPEPVIIHINKVDAEEQREFKNSTNKRTRKKKKLSNKFVQDEDSSDNVLVPEIPLEDKTHNKFLPDESSEKISDESNDKRHFTMKNINRGLFLMTFPEPDKELDLTSEIVANEKEKKTELLDSNLKETDESPKSTTKTDIQRQENVEMAADTPIPSAKTADLSEKPMTEIKNISCTYKLPQMPTLIVANYSKSNLENSDYQLSSVYYQNNVPQTVTNHVLGNNSQNMVVVNTPIVMSNDNNQPELATVVNASPSIAVPQTASISYPESIDSISLLPTEKEISHNLSGVSNETVIDKAVDNISHPGSMDVGSNVASNLSNAAISEVSIPDTFLDAQYVSPEFDIEKEHDAQSKKRRPTLVFHEMDAIAILSILDLDGGVKHSETLLLSLLTKEINELKNIQNVNCETLQADAKAMFELRINQKLDKIKSLQIARGLCLKYGELSNVVNAILSKSVPKVPRVVVNTNIPPFIQIQETILPPEPINHNLIMKQKTEKLESRQACQFSSAVPLVPKPTVEPHPLKRLSSETSIRIKLENSSSCMLNKNSNKSSTTNENYIEKIQSQITGLSPSTSNAHCQSSLSANVLNKHSNSNNVGLFGTPSSQAPMQSLAATAVQKEANNVRRNSTCSTPGNDSGRSPLQEPNMVRSPINIKKEKQDAFEAKSQCSSQNQTGTISQCSFPQTQLSSPNPAVNVATRQMGNVFLQQNASNTKQLQPYQNIQKLPSLTSKVPPPNQVVPFANSQMHLNVNRNNLPVSLQIQGNSIASLNNTNKNYLIGNNQATNNTIRVQHVVLPNTPTTKSHVPNQVQYTVTTPYNMGSYNMAQQPALKPQMYPTNGGYVNVQTQPRQNMYAVHHVPNTATTTYNVISPAGQSNPTTPVPTYSKNDPQAVMSQMFCAVCSKVARLRCKQCAKVAYCNTKCAKIFWQQRHKMECKPTSGVT